MSIPGTLQGFYQMNVRLLLPMSFCLFHSTFFLCYGRSADRKSACRTMTGCQKMAGYSVISQHFTMFLRQKIKHTGHELVDIHCYSRIMLNSRVAFHRFFVSKTNCSFCIIYLLYLGIMKKASGQIFSSAK